MPRPVQIRRDEVWRRRKLGEAFSEIGRAIGAAKQSVHDVVIARGGVAPAPRRRRPGSLQFGVDPLSWTVFDLPVRRLRSSGTSSRS